MTPSLTVQLNHTPSLPAFAALNADALRLYERNGWQVTHRGPHSIYDRCDIGMEKTLGENAGNSSA